MSNHMESLLAISPIDGRYKKKLLKLNQYFSEYGYFKYRLYIELLYLKKICLSLEKNLSKKVYKIIENVGHDFDINECLKIKEYERK